MSTGSKSSTDQIAEINRILECQSEYSVLRTSVTDELDEVLGCLEEGKKFQVNLSLDTIRSLLKQRKKRVALLVHPDKAPQNLRKESKEAMQKLLDACKAVLEKLDSIYSPSPTQRHNSENNPTSAESKRAGESSGESSKAAYDQQKQEEAKKRKEEEQREKEQKDQERREREEFLRKRREEEEQRKACEKLNEEEMRRREAERQRKLREREQRENDLRQQREEEERRRAQDRLDEYLRRNHSASSGYNSFGEQQNPPPYVRTATYDTWSRESIPATYSYQPSNSQYNPSTFIFGNSQSQNPTSRFMPEASRSVFAQRADQSSQSGFDGVQANNGLPLSSFSPNFHMRYPSTL